LRQSTGQTALNASRRSRRNSTDYSDVTELPGSRASEEQLSRLLHRYRTAARHCRGKDVLEVACGGGQGLGCLARQARLLVGADCSETNLRYARRHYQGRAKLVGLDAHRLPFPGGSFDVVILFEAIYYLGAPEEFLAESRRVLRPDGVLVISTVNRDWPDFHPSPHSIRYFSAPELASSLGAAQFEAQLFGAFPASDGSAKGWLLSRIKRTAVKLDLMPGTMKRRELFKRIFLGKLNSIPPELDPGSMAYTPPVPIPSDASDFGFKTLYAVAHALRVGCAPSVPVPPPQGGN